MNVTQQRKVEKVMLGRIDRFREDNLTSVLEEINDREPADDGITEKQYEDYLKSYQSANRASERYTKKVESLGWVSTGYHNKFFEKPGIIDKSEFDAAIRNDRETAHVQNLFSRHYYDGKGGQVTAMREVVARSLAQDEKRARNLYPTLIAWYDRDTLVRDFAEEGLVIDVYLSDGDAEDILDRLTDKLNSLIS
jgi:hypothetical protein